MSKIRVDTSSRIAVKDNEGLLIKVLDGATSQNALEVVDENEDVVASVSIDGKFTLSNIPDNFIILGTDTTDDYITEITAGTGVSVNGTIGEGYPVTISIGQDVSTTASVLFDSVEITGDATFNNLQVISENASIESEDVSFSDNIITLNRNVTDTPLNGGITVNRGTSPNVSIRWNESLDKWQFTNDGTNYVSLTESPENITDVSDVLISSPTNGQALKYDAAQEKWVNGTAVASSGIIGQISHWHSTSIPTGWVVCDGSSLNSYTYKELHKVISNNYGGDAFVEGVTDQPGATEVFSVPNFSGKTANGVSSAPFSPSAVSTGIQSASHSHTVNFDAGGAHVHGVDLTGGEHQHSYSIAAVNHSHSVSFATANQNHNHNAGGTGIQSVGHSHTATVSLPTVNSPHSHPYYINPGFPGFLQSNGGGHTHGTTIASGAGSMGPHNTSGNDVSAEHDHSSTIRASNAIISHQHNTTTGPVSGDQPSHTHTINFNSSEPFLHSHSINLSQDSGHIHNVLAIPQVFIIRANL